MYCTKCGKLVEREDALFCPFCGNPLNRDTYNQSQFTQDTHTQEDTHQGHTYQSSSYQEPPYSDYSRYQRRYDPYDAPSWGWAFLSFIIPIVGLVLYLVWKDESPLKAKSCLKGFIASIVLDIIVFCCFCGAIGSSDYYYYTFIKGIL